MNLKFIIIISLLPFLSNAQGGLIIGSGANIVISNSPQIVINDGKFENDGDFTAAGSTVHIIGNTATENSTIGGAAITTFNNLNIKKSSNDTRIDFDVQVDGDLYMNGGLLFLNYSDIELGGEIIGETETNRITGTDGGAIIKNVILDMPAGKNPGNLGAEIWSTANMGATTFRRSHVQQVNGSNHSIFRFYEIIPTNNSGLDATLRFHYFDAELAGLTENNLQIWEHEGPTWKPLGSESSDVVANWVEVSGIDLFNKVTLAEDMNAPLPIELLRFDAVVNEKKEVELSWTTLTEINNDYFTIERSKDGILFEPIADIPGAGTTTQAMTYKSLDQQPYAGVSYYLLKQTDFDGTSSTSEIRVVNIQLDQRFSVYPNPLQEVLHVVGDGLTRGKAILEIFDATGHLKYSKRLEMDDQVTSIDIKEVADFMAGTYFLVIQTREETYNFNLVKVLK